MTAVKTARKPRKLVTINPNKKDSFSIGVSAENYHFITKVAAANEMNRQQVLDEIIGRHAAMLLRGTTLAA